MFNNFTPERVFLYAMAAGLLSIFIAIFYVYSQFSAVASLQTQVTELHEIARLTAAKQATNKAVMSHFANADKFYIDKNIETIELLKNEREILEKIAKQNHTIEDEEMKGRLDFLKEKNGLVFAEGMVETRPAFTETTETLTHSVEINLNDLKTILTRIEGVPFGEATKGEMAPQLIITDLHMEKKATTKENEVFTLHLKLLKREF